MAASPHLLDRALAMPNLRRAWDEVAYRPFRTR